MAVEHRKDRGKWGYRFYLHGTCYKKYAWGTKGEARKAEREARVDLEKNPPLALAPLELLQFACQDDGFGVLLIIKELADKGSNFLDAGRVFLEQLPDDGFRIVDAIGRQ